MCPYYQFFSGVHVSQMSYRFACYNILCMYLVMFNSTTASKTRVPQNTILKLQINMVEIMFSIMLSTCQKTRVYEFNLFKLILSLFKSHLIYYSFTLETIALSV